MKNSPLPLFVGGVVCSADSARLLAGENKCVHAPPLVCGHEIFILRAANVH